MRQTVDVEFAHAILCDRQRLIIGGHGAAVMHRPDLHADSRWIDLFEHGTSAKNTLDEVRLL
jgi:hypothetical protein